MFPFLNKMMLGSAGGLNVDEVFGTNLYTGDSAARSFTFPNLKPSGTALHWNKRRSGTGTNQLFDTVRGLSTVNSDQTAAASSSSTLSNLRGNGFDVSSGALLVNTSGQTSVNCTFQTAPKFFDIVTYTGSGVAGRVIAHNASPIGFMTIKRLDTTSQWTARHISATGELVLNTTAAQLGTQTRITAVSNVSFTVSADAAVNASGGTYIAYIWAHDPDPSGIIQCGSFVKPSSGDVQINLPWEPQFLLTKSATATSDWFMLDTKRGWGVGNDAFLRANLTAAEGIAEVGAPNSNGFNVAQALLPVGSTAIYMAIRKGSS